jgi:hypothetical protein
MTQKEKLIIKEAIELCSKYNFWDKTSCQIALHNVKKFLKDNFNTDD